MVFIIILIAILIIGGIVLTLFGIAKDTDAGLTVLGGTLLVVIGVIIPVIGRELDNPQPKAIDVYRGKTTLQITYQDSIPIDTTVVWKEEK